jgi:hypothetical protein
MGSSQTKVVAKVFATTDYALFSYRADNREIKEDNVRAKIKSIEIMGQQLPIKVDGNYVVQDGQHRLEACKKLGIPVKFIIDEDGELTTKELALLQSSTKGWNSADFAHSFAESSANSLDYQMYNKFSKLYPEFSHTIICILLTDLRSYGAYINKSFTEGTFKVKSFNKGCQIAEMLRLIQPYYKYYAKKSFVIAFLKMTDNKDFDMKRLLRKLPKRCKELMDFSRVEDYTAALELIYNWNETKKVYFR